MRERILVVDDDPGLRSLLELGLTRSGYRVAVEAEGGSALANFEAHAPELAIVDVMMPQMDGWEVVRRIRAISNIPILLLTAKSLDTDKARGLDLGADDYLTKPFSLIELDARIRALLRRSRPAPPIQEEEVVAGPLTISLAAHRVLSDGVPVSLTPTEYRILALLAQNADRVVPIEHLLHQVWGAEFVAEREYVKPYISRLRKKLRNPVEGPGAIETVFGTGYRLVR